MLKSLKKNLNVHSTILTPVIKTQLIITNLGVLKTFPSCDGLCYVNIRGEPAKSVSLLET